MYDHLDINIDNIFDKIGVALKKHPIVNFDKDGNVEGWHFIVNKAFKNSLGMTKNRHSIGTVISFERGDIFYNHKNAIIDGKWNDFLEIEGATALQIEHCNSSGITNHQFKKGYIRFNVLKPNTQKTSLQITSTLECNILQFLTVLKNGLPRQ